MYSQFMRYLNVAQPPPVVATVHPSSILRATDEESRETAMSSFTADLKVAAENV
jgi:uracil-DNA glycosylase